MLVRGGVKPHGKWFGWIMLIHKGYEEFYDSVHLRGKSGGAQTATSEGPKP